MSHIDIPPEDKGIDHLRDVLGEYNRTKGIKEVSLREINSQFVNRQEIAVEGKAVAISDPEIIPSSVVYLCNNCDEIDPTRFKSKPKKCPRCAESDFRQEEDDLEDVQVIKIHEIKGKNNHIAKLVIVARGKEAMWRVRAGQKIRAVGKLKIDKVKLTLDREERPVKRLEATELKVLDNIEVKLTEQDIAKIKEMVKDPLHWQILVESFAPHIFGLEEQKEVCIYTLGSCNSPRPFNSLLGGPPGRAKTHLLEWTAAMHPIGVKLTAAGASMPGLTSITKKDVDTGAHITELGLFALYDGGIVCITELQAIKGKDEVKSGLNDALESKEVSGAKAGGLIKFQARCSVLFDTNNFTGSWSYGFSLAHNLKYLEPNLGAFLSRLDHISISPEINDDEYYAQVARSNFSVTTTEEALEKFKDDYEVGGVPHYGVDTLVKYFIHVTGQPLPPISKNSEEHFVNNFVKVSKEAKEFTVDGRYNRIVKTTAQVRARMLLKPEADEEDLAVAIEKVNKGKDIQTKTEDGDNDANAALGLKSKKLINQEEQFLQSFEKACRYQADKGEDGTWCKEDDVVFWLMADYKWDEDKAARFVNRRLNNAQGIPVFLVNSGKWKKA